MPPIIGLAVYCCTGKTTLREKLIHLFTEKGLIIGLIKTSHHTIELDKPSKDSFKLSKASARQLVLSPPKCSICSIAYQATHNKPTLTEQVQLLDHERLDLMVIESFKDANIPKIELYRSTLDRPYLFNNDSNMIAIATDAPILQRSATTPVLDINNPAQIATFILNQTDLERADNDRLL